MPAKSGAETSVRQVVHRRRAHAARGGRASSGYFAAATTPTPSRPSCRYLLVHQIGAFNSPVWFNCGLWHEYGISGSGGNFAWDARHRQRPYQTEDAYSRPQSRPASSSRCDDDLMCIFELVHDEARRLQVRLGHRHQLLPSCAASMERLSGGGTSSRPDELPRGARQGRRRHQVAAAPRGARPRWSCSTWTTPRSSTSSSWKMREEKKVARADRGGLLVGLQRRGLPHRLRPELQQLGARDRRVHARRCSRTAMWQTTHPHHRRGRRDARARAIVARDRRRRLALRRPGRAVRRHHQRLAHLPQTDRINASNPCSRVHVPRRHRLQPVVAEPAQVPERRTARFDVEGYRHACRIFFLAQEILVDFASYPTKRIASNSHDLPPARPRLRQPRHAADGRWASPTTPTQGARCAASLTAIMYRPRLRASRPRSPAAKGPFPGYAHEPRAACCEVMRMHRDAASHIDRDAAAAETLHRRRARGWDARRRARRAARLPQRAGHGARAHRHHRPADGLRHHRRRARLRAGQVQEARRRRLLQDRQPVGAAGAADASATRRPRCRRSSPTCAARTRSRRRRRTSTARRCKARGLRRRRDRQGREAAARACSTCEQRLRAARRSATTPTSGSALEPNASAASSASRCCEARASPTRRSRRPTTSSAAA